MWDFKIILLYSDYIEKYDSVNTKLYKILY